MFHHPFCCIVSGPTRSGKSTFTSRFIKSRKCIVDKPLEQVIFCYSEWQPLYDDLQNYDPTIVFHVGPPDLNFLRETKDQPKLLILDDLMQNYSNKKNSSDLMTLFTVGSHHWNASCIHLVQNLFNENLRTARINAQYIVLTKNPADKAQALCLQRQIYPGNKKYFLESLVDAWVMNKFGYLLIDLTPQLDDDLRLRTCIFPEEQQFCYIKKDKRPFDRLNKTHLEQCLTELKEI